MTTSVQIKVPWRERVGVTVSLVDDGGNTREKRYLTPSDEAALVVWRGTRIIIEEIPDHEQTPAAVRPSPHPHAHRAKLEDPARVA